MRVLREALRAGALELAAASVAEPRLEAEILLAEALGRPRSFLFAHPETQLAPAVLERFSDLLRRRRGGEPVAYLRGHQEFWSLDLLVTPATLIPRPETELLVELALRELPPTPGVEVLDLGTGCGAVALALAAERPGWRVHGVDASAEAVAVAAANCERLGLSGLDLRVGDWLTPFSRLAFDAILGNPPYVAENDPHLARGDLRFEPRAALVSGPEGLDAIGEIAAAAPAGLKPGGRIWLEHGWQQGPAVRRILDRSGFEAVRSWPDLAGKERVTGGRRGAGGPGVA